MQQQFFHTIGLKIHYFRTIHCSHLCNVESTKSNTNPYHLSVRAIMQLFEQNGFLIHKSAFNQSRATSSSDFQFF